MTSLGTLTSKALTNKITPEEDFVTGLVVRESRRVRRPVLGLMEKRFNAWAGAEPDSSYLITPA